MTNNNKKINLDILGKNPYEKKESSSRSVSSSSKNTKQSLDSIKKVKEETKKGLFNIRKNKSGHISEESEKLALLCDKMHFDAKEAYKLLRTNVTFTLPDNNSCRVIAITSPIRGEGKSTVSINLAYTFAATNSKVLLIDMDMRLPSIANKLNVETKIGLSDFLIGKAKKKEIIYNSDKYPNWDIIFAGSIPPTPAELIGSNAMADLMISLKKEYDFIIIDLPPVNIVSDALVAKDISDGYIVTVREGYSDKKSLGECIRQLEFLDANILGFVMADSSGNDSYYSDHYSRYNRYYRKRKYGYYKNKYNYYYKKPN